MTDSFLVANNLDRANNCELRLIRRRANTGRFVHCLLEIQSKYLRRTWLCFCQGFGFSPIVTTKHYVMKYMKNDEYFILFIRHFPCPSPIECIHQHPIKWIHQCICTQRDITGHWSQGELV